MMNTSARLVFSSFAATLALGLASGCFAFGTRFDAEAVSHLKPGTTTLLDVREQFGEPTWELKDNVRGKSELCIIYGPGNADYEFRFSVSDRLIGFRRVIHTGCVEIVPGFGSGGNEPLSVPVPLVDPSVPSRFVVGTTTQAEAADVLGACREASLAKFGGFQMTWGPDSDQWVLDFDTRGFLSRPPTHEVRPELWNAEGV